MDLVLLQHIISIPEMTVTECESMKLNWWTCVTTSISDVRTLNVRLSTTDVCSSMHFLFLRDSTNVYNIHTTNVMVMIYTHNHCDSGNVRTQPMWQWQCTSHNQRESDNVCTQPMWQQQHMHTTNVTVTMYATQPMRQWQRMYTTNVIVTMYATQPTWQWQRMHTTNVSVTMYAKQPTWKWQCMHTANVIVNNVRQTTNVKVTTYAHYQRDSDNVCTQFMWQWQYTPHNQCDSDNVCTHKQCDSDNVHTQDQCDGDNVHTQPMWQRQRTLTTNMRVL